MLNPNATGSSGSYSEVRNLVLAHLRTAHLPDHIFELMQAAFNSALAEAGLVLSAAEKRRLLQDVMKHVLHEMSRKLEAES